MHVEMGSDIACRWRYVGKRRPERALAQFDHADEVSVTWRAFERDSEVPAKTTGAATAAGGGLDR